MKELFSKPFSKLFGKPLNDIPIPATTILLSTTQMSIDRENFDLICDAYCDSPLHWPGSLFRMYMTMKCIVSRLRLDYTTDQVKDLARTLWLKHGMIFDYAHLCIILKSHSTQASESSSLKPLSIRVLRNHPT